MAESNMQLMTELKELKTLYAEMELVYDRNTTQSNAELVQLKEHLQNFAILQTQLQLENEEMKKELEKMETNHKTVLDALNYKLNDAKVYEFQVYQLKEKNEKYLQTIHDQKEKITEKDVGSSCGF